MADCALFSACLEAYRAAGHALPEDTEFPDLDWEGWRDIADRLGIAGSVDAPLFRARVAVKIAAAADEANLRGERVRFGEVEARLLEVLSGDASLSQVPDTQAEDALLRPPRARIVLSERSRRGRRTETFYEVVLGSRLGEEGTWLSLAQLKQHFLGSWEEMVADYKERLVKGTLLDGPSPADAGMELLVMAGAGDSVQQHQQQQPAAPAVLAPGGATSSLGSGRRGGGGGRLGMPAVAAPVGPRNIPVESQPEPQPLLYDRAQAPAPSLLLAGINLVPPVQAARLGHSRQPAAPQARQHQGGAASGTAAGAVSFAAWQAARPAAQQAAPAHGAGQHAERAAQSAGQGAAQGQRGGQAVPGSRPPLTSPFRQAGGPAAPGLAAAPAVRGQPAASGLSAGRAALGGVPAATVGPAPVGGLGRFFFRKGREPAAAQVAAAGGAGAAAMAAVARPGQHLRAWVPPGWAASPAVPAVAAGQQRSGQVGAGPRPQLQPRPAQYDSGQAAVTAAAFGAAAPQAAAPGRSPPGGLRPVDQAGRLQKPVAARPVETAAAENASAALQRTEQAQTAMEVEIHVPARQGQKVVMQERAAEEQPAAKRQRRAQPAQQEHAHGPPQQLGQSGGAPAAVPGRRPAPQPAAGWQAGSEDEGDVAFQRGLQVLAALQNKAPSPSKLDPAGRLLPPAVEPAAAAPAAAHTAAGAGAQPGGGALHVGGSLAEEDEFHDAREFLESSQGAPQDAAATAQQQQQQRPRRAGKAQPGAGGAVASVPPVAARALGLAHATGEAGAGLPPGALHLRTQPDEVQWTNIHDLEPTDSLPDTQVVQPSGAQTVPDTEEEVVEPQQGQQRAASRQQLPQQDQEQEEPRDGHLVRQAGLPPPQQQAVPAAQGPLGTESKSPSPPSPSPSSGRSAGAGPAQAAEHSGSEGEEDEALALAGRFKGSTIRGAKSTDDGVQLYVQWPDGSQGLVQASSLHDMAHDDCPGCWVLSKLCQFYESKTRHMPKRKGSSRGGGSRGPAGAD